MLTLKVAMHTRMTFSLPADWAILVSSGMMSNFLGHSRQYIKP
jgi:hypothetical protein